MAYQPVEFKTPAKGVNKNRSFSEHAQDTAIDALNVLPFDIDGRGRAGQRPGTSKLWAAAIGSGVEPVSFMAQVTTALDPSLVDPDQLLLNEQFDYADGTQLHDVGGAGTTWRVSRSPTFATNGLNGPTLTDPASIVVNGGRAERTTSTGVAGAVYMPNLVLGDSYVIRLKGKVGMQFSSAPLRICVRLNKTTFSASEGVCLILDKAEILFRNPSQIKASHTFATALDTSIDYVLELRVNGNVFHGLVNGVPYISYTETQYTTNTGVGFAVVAGQVGGVASFEVYAGKNLASYRNTNIVAVAGDDIYIGDSDSQGVLVSGSNGAIHSGVRPQGAFSAGQLYIVDGYGIYQVDMTRRETVTYAATAGSAPENCTLACMYRDRLVLAAPRDNPQNFFFSRVGTHTDWDYSQTDSAAAFAGNASTAGRIGEPIVSLMPFADDVLLIGGDHNLWAVRGDPADGGSIDLISDAVGILGPNAWAQAPDGTIYFLGTGGLFRMAPGGSSPENISSSQWNQFFKNLDRAANYVILAWDRDNQGLYIFVTPVNTGTATHLWYDLRTGGFWPLRMPDGHGPVSALVYDGDATNDRFVLMGGRDGHIYKWDVSATGSDDGTAITSHLEIGPFRASESVESVMEWLDVLLGEPQTGQAASDYNVTLSVKAGNTVEQAVNNPSQVRTRTFTKPGRQSMWINRTRGNAFTLRLSNSTLNKTWNFEKAVGMFMPGGLVRRR